MFVLSSRLMPLLPEVHDMILAWSPSHSYDLNRYKLIIIIITTISGNETKDAS